MHDLLKPGENCYRLANAGRAALLVDGDAYYRALDAAFRLARRSIFIVGWDLHSDLQLVRGGADRRYPDRLGALLDRLAAEREDLHVYLLGWDFSMIYALEREFFPRYKLKWRTHRRIHFCLDGEHPIGASQHQKIVVIDDALAFCGGFDLSKWRWDTPAHRPDDPRRLDPDGKPYAPFHDIQMAVDGAAAVVLSGIARQRWERAGGCAPVTSVASPTHDPWPAGVEPDFRDIAVAVARTLPAHKDQAAVREVERLYLDSIAAARRSIYIENQYLSSHRVGQALKARLEEADGPEVVIVMPRRTGGWLEQHTMDVLRGRILSDLRGVDRHDRLRTFYPRVGDGAGGEVMVHAKVMVIDDALLRVGSSNLSNRSMGLDSECDLAVAAGPDDDAVRHAIVSFRNRLLSEHLACTPETVDAAATEAGSLIGAIAALRGGDHTLVPLSGEVPADVDRWIPDSELLDPEQPVAPDKLFDHVVEPDQQPFAIRHLMRIILLIAGILLLAAVWRWTPLGDWLDMDSARAAGEWLRAQPFTPLMVLACYVLGGVAVVPVTLMIVASVLVFGTWWGLFYALAGSWLSAMAVFWIGRLAGRDTVRRFAGSLINRLSHKLSSSGLLAVITVRVVPVAPFSVINLIAGVSAIRTRDFALGTLVGMLPGVVAVVLLADRISASLQQPDLWQFVLLGIAVLLVAAALAGLRHWIRRKNSEQASETGA